MSRAPISLRAVESLHVGGELVRLEGIPVCERVGVPGNPPRRSDQNGTHAVGQLYVQRFLLSQPRARYPLLLWHGGGLTGACWETTPDGRPGWHDFFMRAGHDTWVSDASERGRASWARYPELNRELPEHRSIDAAWGGSFRFGPPGSYDPDPAGRRGFEGCLFPLGAAEQLLRQFVARWTTPDSDRWTEAAYKELVRLAGDCVVLCHSQGGRYALKAASADPAVRALVCLEPVVPLLAEIDPASFAGRPILLVLGDNRPANPRQDAFFAALRAAGAQLEVVDLPTQGVFGNSHMLMMDSNSDAIAATVQAWFVRVGLMQHG